MTKWVEIDESKYSQPVREGRPGLPQIERAISTYEIPVRVGVMHDSSSPTTLVLAFEYLSPEPETDHKVSDTLRVKTGIHSGRLRKAIVDLAPLFKGTKIPNGEMVASYVTSQVKAYLQGLPKPTSSLGMRRIIPGQVLTDNQQTFSSIVGPSWHQTTEQ